MTQEMPGLVPRPDPTLLTTEALMREVTALRQTLDARIDHLTETIMLRVSALAEVSDQRFENLNRALHDQLETRVTALHDLTRLIESRFKQTEERAAEQKQDTKIAVDAAFLAARDAVSAQAESSSKAIEKQELSTSKQIDAITALIAQTVDGISTQITDLKERVDRAEGGALGGAQAVTESYRSRNMMATAIGAVVGLLGIGLAIAVAVSAGS